MPENNQRKEDKVEVSLDNITGVLLMMGAVLICILFFAGIIVAVAVSRDRWGDIDPGTFLAVCAPFVLVIAMVAVIMYFAKLIITYLIDIHYYLRMLMERSENKQTDTPQDEKAPPAIWYCSYCGTQHSSSESSCSCGYQRIMPDVEHMESEIVRVK